MPCNLISDFEIRNQRIHYEQEIKTMEEKLNQANSDKKRLERLLEEREDALSLLDTQLSKAVWFHAAKTHLLVCRTSPTCKRASSTQVTNRK